MSKDGTKVVEDEEINGKVVQAQTSENQPQEDLPKLTEDEATVVIEVKSKDSTGTFKILIEKDEPHRVRPIYDQDLEEKEQDMFKFAVIAAIMASFSE